MLFRSRAPAEESAALGVDGPATSSATATVHANGNAMWRRRARARPEFPGPLICAPRAVLLGRRYRPSRTRTSDGGHSGAEVSTAGSGSRGAPDSRSTATVGVEVPCPDGGISRGDGLARAGTWGRRPVDTTRSPCPSGNARGPGGNGRKCTECHPPEDLMPRQRHSLMPVSWHSSLSQLDSDPIHEAIPPVSRRHTSVGNV